MANRVPDDWRRCSPGRGRDAGRPLGDRSPHGYRVVTGVHSTIFRFKSLRFADQTDATPTTIGPSGKQDTFCLRDPSSLPPLLTHQTSLNIWHEWRRETSRRRPRTKERQLYGPPVAVGGQGPGPGGASPAGPAR
ncbi:hypothetical protein Bbelb_415120 [Branchiostoma belcheri]|nr:hypothetical protein Bbelb_415120 [Branchiostoma belcheri]